MHIGYGSWRNEIEMVMKTGWVIYIDLEVDVYIWLARKLIDELLWDSACFLYRWSIICMCYLTLTFRCIHPCVCVYERDRVLDVIRKVMEQSLRVDENPILQRPFWEVWLLTLPIPIRHTDHIGPPTFASIRTSIYSYKCNTHI